VKCEIAFTPRETPHDFSTSTDTRIGVAGCPWVQQRFQPRSGIRTANGQRRPRWTRTATDEHRAAFTRYAVAAVDEFGTEHTTYELWNEWNLRDPNGAAKASPENYAALLKSVSAAVRAKHPDVKPLDPEASVAYVNTIRSIMAAHGASKPIYISEQGWATGSNPSAVSEPAQARDLVRGQLLAYGNGVARYSSYNFMRSSHGHADVQQPGCGGALVHRGCWWDRDEWLGRSGC
jgi:hypothetical protein